MERRILWSLLMERMNMPDGEDEHADSNNLNDEWE